MKIVIRILIVLVVLGVGLGIGLAAFSTHIRRQTLEQAREWQAAHYDISWYDTIEKTEYTVKSYDGYELHVQFLANPEKTTDRYVVISHGYSDNRLGSLKYAMLYFNLGYNVIVYDLRGHGENKPTFCTYSVRESRDLLALLEDTRTRYPEARVLGIHGESLGAGTSIACLKEHPQIDFVVADCGFSEIKAVLKSGNLPEWPVDYASFFAKLLYGYSLDEMRPIDSLADNEVPILFIHGEEDDFIAPWHSEAMQEATKGYSEVHLIPAGHAESVLTAPADYMEYVRHFSGPFSCCDRFMLIYRENAKKCLC